MEFMTLTKALCCSALEGEPRTSPHGRGGCWPWRSQTSGASSAALPRRELPPQAIRGPTRSKKMKGADDWSRGCAREPSERELRLLPGWTAHES